MFFSAPTVIRSLFTARTRFDELRQCVARHPQRGLDMSTKDIVHLHHVNEIRSSVARYCQRIIILSVLMMAPRSIGADSSSPAWANPEADIREAEAAGTAIQAKLVELRAEYAGVIRDRKRAFLATVYNDNLDAKTIAERVSIFASAETRANDLESALSEHEHRLADTMATVDRLKEKVATEMSELKALAEPTAEAASKPARRASADEAKRPSAPVGNLAANYLTTALSKPVTSVSSGSKVKVSGTAAVGDVEVPESTRSSTAVRPATAESVTEKPVSTAEEPTAVEPTASKPDTIAEPEAPATPIAATIQAPATSAPEKSSTSGLLIDDFNTGAQMNRLGGRISIYERSPSSAMFGFVDDVIQGKSSAALSIEFDKQQYGGPHGTGGWCGFYSILKDETTGQYTDASAYEYLSFWVKSDSDVENFVIGLADKRWEVIGDSYKSRNVTSYVDDGKLGPTWKKARIPLREFRIERAQLAAVSICFETSCFSDGGARGIVYIDDLRFE